MNDKKNMNVVKKPKKKMKKQILLIIIVVAVAVTIVLVLFFNTLLPLILEGILGVDNIDSVGKALLLK